MGFLSQRELRGTCVGRVPLSIAEMQVSSFDRLPVDEISFQIAISFISTVHIRFAIVIGPIKYGNLHRLLGPLFFECLPPNPSLPLIQFEQSDRDDYTPRPIFAIFLHP